MNILVIDGQGGRLGRKLVESIREACPDAVIIAVPNYQHAPMFKLAAEHGKHILCEKPLTMTVEMGEKMVAWARQYNANPEKVDTVVLAQAFRFPATNYGQSTNKISLAA